jgi:hydrogenase maturation protease
VVLIDACASGSEPGSIFEVPGSEVENLPPLTGIHLHSFRWDHALAFAHWLLKDDYPKGVTVFLIEAEKTDLGEGLSPSVDAAVNKVVELLLQRFVEVPT